MSTKEEGVPLPAVFAWLATHDPAWAAAQRRHYLAPAETRAAHAPPRKNRAPKPENSR